MTREMGGVLIIEPEPHRECQFCHQVAECRPYGPGKQDICWPCAQKPENLEALITNMEERLDRVKSMARGDEIIPLRPNQKTLDSLLPRPPSSTAGEPS